MKLSRRRFLAQSTIAAAVFSVGSPAFATSGDEMGAIFDEAIKAYMKPRNCPAAALAVVKDKRLVYCQAYGFADVEKKEVARPDSLFRIASITKPFTAVAVLKLAAAGRLQMDQPAFAMLDLKPLGGRTPDPRLKDITVRHLLHHTGGWDRDKSGDPMFMSERIAEANNEHPPANQHAIIRWMLGRNLDSDPGARYAYSNFGYCVLGRVIEKVTGLTYADYVQQEVLKPIGISRMRQGKTGASGRADGEVKYYMPGRAPNEPVDDGEPYTGFCLEAMDSHGAWIASAIDLARFGVALDDAAHTEWLPESARQLIYERPAPPADRNAAGELAPVFYGCGWEVRPAGRRGKPDYWHNGSLPGTSTWLVRHAEGLSWALLFNQRSSDRALPDNAIMGAINEAANAVTAWPDHDLFGKYS